MSLNGWKHTAIQRRPMLGVASGWDNASMQQFRALSQILRQHYFCCHMDNQHLVVWSCRQLHFRTKFARAEQNFDN